MIYLLFALVAIVGGYDFLIYQATWAHLILGILIGGGLFLLLVVGTKGRGMGWGDVKLGTLLGIVLGYPLIIVALFLSCILGSFYALSLVVMKRKTLKDPIPFGPFLVLGALIALFFGKYIIAWYLGV